MDQLKNISGQVVLEICGLPLPLKLKTTADKGLF
jgi:hypothetical protein